GGVDVLGSILITLAAMLGAYAIVKSTDYGVFSVRTLAVGGASLALLGAFLALEARIANPIMPLRVLRLRMLMGSSLVRGLLVTGMFSAFFLGSLYLERVLGYDAIHTGLAFLPLTVSIGVLSMGISARAVERFGAIGLASLGTIATDHAKALSSSGHSLTSALTGGYHLAYVVAAACVAVGILASFLLLRPPTAPVLQEAEETVETNADLLGAPE